MARKDDEFYRREENASSGRRAITIPSKTIVANSHDPAADEPRDLESLDLGTEEESPFLRAPRRIPVRRSGVNRRTANRLKIAVLALAGVAVIAGAAGALYGYATSSWRFRVDSSDDLEIIGVQNVSRRQVVEVFGSDIGRNIFFVPLATRQKQLEDIPWVESAAVMRLLPNRLRVQLSERTPVAFLRVGSKINLIDANGVVMNMPARGSRGYSFPVIVGAEGNEPVSTWAARMKIFARLVRELDSGGAHYSEALSEVNLDDPEDLKATFADPNGAVLVHLGDGQFLERYKIYLAHVNEWRQQFPHLESVDLRYDRQVVVNPDSAPAASPPSAKSPPAARRSPARSTARHR